ncbi:MAG: hypothetical protein M3O22_01520 [Pseudomonadota bacterium]|nr:hypothetical protein [Pseudomonadota bacterium]
MLRFTSRYLADRALGQVPVILEEAANCPPQILEQRLVPYVLDLWNFLTGPEAGNPDQNDLTPLVVADTLVSLCIPGPQDMTFINISAVPGMTAEVILEMQNRMRNSLAGRVPQNLSVVPAPVSLAA